MNLVFCSKMFYFNFDLFFSFFFFFVSEKLCFVWHEFAFFCGKTKSKCFFTRIQVWKIRSFLFSLVIGWYLSFSFVLLGEMLFGEQKYPQIMQHILLWCSCVRNATKVFVLKIVLSNQHCQFTFLSPFPLFWWLVEKEKKNNTSNCIFQFKLCFQFQQFSQMQTILVCLFCLQLWTSFCWEPMEEDWFVVKTKENQLVTDEQLLKEPMWVKMRCFVWGNLCEQGSTKHEQAQKKTIFSFFLSHHNQKRSKFFVVGIRFYEEGIWLSCLWKCLCLKTVKGGLCVLAQLGIWKIQKQQWHLITKTLLAQQNFFKQYQKKHKQTLLGDSANKNKHKQTQKNLVWSLLDENDHNFDSRKSNKLKTTFLGSDCDDDKWWTSNTKRHFCWKCETFWPKKNCSVVLQHFEAFPFLLWFLDWICVNFLSFWIFCDFLCLHRLFKETCESGLHVFSVMTVKPELGPNPVTPNKKTLDENFTKQNKTNKRKKEKTRQQNTQYLLLFRLISREQERNRHLVCLFVEISIVQRKNTKKKQKQQSHQKKQTETKDGVSENRKPNSLWDVNLASIDLAMHELYFNCSQLQQLVADIAFGEIFCERTSRAAFVVFGSWSMTRKKEKKKERKKKRKKVNWSFFCFFCFWFGEDVSEMIRVAAIIVTPKNAKRKSQSRAIMCVVKTKNGQDLTLPSVVCQNTTNRKPNGHFLLFWSFFLFSLLFFVLSVFGPKMPEVIVVVDLARPQEQQEDENVSQFLFASAMIDIHDELIQKFSPCCWLIFKNKQTNKNTKKENNGNKSASARKITHKTGQSDQECLEKLHKLTHNHFTNRFDNRLRNSFRRNEVKNRTLHRTCCCFSFSIFWFFSPPQKETRISRDDRETNLMIWDCCAGAVGGISLCEKHSPQRFVWVLCVNNKRWSVWFWFFFSVLFLFVGVCDCFFLFLIFWFLDETNVQARIEGKWGCCWRHCWICFTLLTSHSPALLFLVETRMTKEFRNKRHKRNK